MNRRLEDFLISFPGHVVSSLLGIAIAVALCVGAVYLAGGHL